MAQGRQRPSLLVGGVPAYAGGGELLEIGMNLPLVYFGAVALVCGMAMLVVRWLVNRPLMHEVYSPEELVDELNEAFVERYEIQITTTLEYLPLFLEKLAAPIGTGFPEAKIAGLIHRMSNQSTYRIRSAIFPVIVDGVASDLDFQWLRVSEERVQIRVEAVAEVIAAGLKAVPELPATAMAG